MTAVVVIGSGFAGLWAALGAARRLDELAVPQGTVDITVLSAKPFHDVRVRNYETDLSACRIPLADLLETLSRGRKRGTDRGLVPRPLVQGREHRVLPGD